MVIILDRRLSMVRVAIKNETGSWHWALIAASYTTAVAWIVSAAVYQIGSVFIG